MNMNRQVQYGAMPTLAWTDNTLNWIVGLLALIGIAAAAIEFWVAGAWEGWEIIAYIAIGIMGLVIVLRWAQGSQKLSVGMGLYFFALLVAGALVLIDLATGSTDHAYASLIVGGLALLIALYYAQLT